MRLPIFNDTEGFLGTLDIEMQGDSIAIPTWRQGLGYSEWHGNLLHNFEQFVIVRRNGMLHAGNADARMIRRMKGFLPPEAQSSVVN